MTHKEVISFVLEYIIHRFGITQTLTTDQDAFMSHWFQEFSGYFRINLLESTPYYPQANDKTNSRNKNLIKLIKN